MVFQYDIWYAVCHLVRAYPPVDVELAHQRQSFSDLAQLVDAEAYAMIGAT